MKRFGIKNRFIRVCESTNEIVNKTDLFQPSYAQMIEPISAQMIEVSLVHMLASSRSFMFVPSSALCAARYFHFDY